MTNLDTGVVSRQLLSRRISLKIVCWGSLFREPQSKMKHLETGSKSYRQY